MTPTDERPTETEQTELDPLFSLICPTRRRLAKLQRFVDSVRTNLWRRSDHEFILVIDADDTETIAYADEQLDVVTAIVPPGQTMGVLCQTGYEASSGRYVMLCTDDLICRCVNWDQIVLEQLQTWPDDIGLVWPNDRIFRETIATFPIVPRKMYELQGRLTSPRFKRYSIDNAIMNVFERLKELGEDRMVYLDDVIFDHDHHTLQGPEKRYVPIGADLTHDSRVFHELAGERQALAEKLLAYIRGTEQKTPVP